MRQKPANGRETDTRHQTRIMKGKECVFEGRGGEEERREREGEGGSKQGNKIRGVERDRHTEGGGVTESDRVRDS